MASLKQIAPSSNVPCLISNRLFDPPRLLTSFDSSSNTLSKQLQRLNIQHVHIRLATAALLSSDPPSHSSGPIHQQRRTSSCSSLATVQVLMLPLAKIAIVLFSLMLPMLLYPRCSISIQKLALISARSISCGCMTILRHLHLCTQTDNQFRENEDKKEENLWTVGEPSTDIPQWCCTGDSQGGNKIWENNGKFGAEEATC